MFPAKVKSNSHFKTFVLSQSRPEAALLNVMSARMRVLAIRITEIRHYAITVLMVTTAVKISLRSFI